MQHIKAKTIKNVFGTKKNKTCRKVEKLKVPSLDNPVNC